MCGLDPREQWAYEALIRPRWPTPKSRLVMIERLIPAVFVLLWSTGWIVAKFGAFHASPLLFLVIRFGLAIVLLPASV